MSFSLNHSEPQVISLTLILSEDHYYFRLEIKVMGAHWMQDYRLRYRI